MTDDGKSNWSFQKLKGGDNWKEWRRNMTYALMDCSLFDYVTGDFPRPTSLTTDEKDLLKAQMDWDKGDRRAGAKLRLMCSSEIQQILDPTEGKTALEKWGVLKEKCTLTGCCT